VISEGKPRWQQVTALVSLGASGTITGFSFVPSAPADLTSPTSMPIRLMALEKSATAVPATDAALRSAIVNVANYYLRMAQGKTPAEMEAIIWQHDSIDGVDHGESCAAFASLTLELAAHVVGQRSWVTGGTTYPWPLHKWADVRVDPNSDSPDIISVLQDAQAHGRWHAVGDGYTPQPGDWVLFDGHVEVVTKYAGGVLSTIGGDSLPNFSVNAHEYSDPLPAQGVAGFVNNGNLAPAAAQPSLPGSQPGAAPAAQPSSAPGAQGSTVPGAPATAPTGAAPASPGSSAIPGAPAASSAGSAVAAQTNDAAIPGMAAPAAGGGHARQTGHRAKRGHWHATHGTRPRQQANPAPAVAADVPGASVYGPSMAPGPAGADTAAIPGLAAATKQASGATTPYRRHRPAPSTAPISAASAQQAFINAVAPGAMATQRRFGVPAAVTIAQAIDESGWGQSMLAANDHNLFGIKGTGPAGSDVQPTEEYENGQWITTNAPFRVYHNFAQSIEDHGQLLASSGYYTQAMANRNDPNAFANDLTGVYATNPEYGADLINLMQQYNLYRYDAAPPSSHAAPRPSSGRTATPRPSGTSPSPGPSTAPAGSSPSAAPPPPTIPAPSPSVSQPAPGAPQPSPSASQPSPGASQPTTTAPQPSPSASAPAQATPGSPPAGAGPSPAAAGPSAGNQAWADIPGVTASTRGSSAATAGPAPTRGRASGAARRTPARAPQGAPAAGRTSPPAAEPAPSAAPEPTTQSFSYQHLSAAMSPVRTTSAFRPATPDDRGAARKAPRKSRPAARYQPHMPPSVSNAFAVAAKTPLTRSELLYRDVAGQAGIPWQLLAACDWMQCEARPRYSPVHGEKLGAVNADGTAYRTKSSALEQCAYDLVDLVGSVYGIDLTARRLLSVGDLASAFAAFRWGGLLRQHHTSPMEFPYSVAGLTVQHMCMRWPKISERHTPDKPGGRFRRPFGAVPVVLSLNYPATT
jgi:flagellum-specific peptidoglycan hydrolase FlgJ